MHNRIKSITDTLFSERIIAKVLEELSGRIKQERGVPRKRLVLKHTVGQQLEIHKSKSFPVYSLYDRPDLDYCFSSSLLFSFII